MSLTVTRRIANLLIWVGLVLMIVGFSMAYPFVRDAIEAQSDPEARLSFVVTLPPAPTQAAILADTSTPVPTPSAAATATSTVPTPTPLPSATGSPTPTPSATASATSASEPTPTPLPSV